MDAPSVPSDPDRELAELRERAYGPHADILTDAAALARLSELEAAHLMRRPAPRDVPDALTTFVAGPPREPSGTELRERDAEPTAASGESAAPDDSRSEHRAHTPPRTHRATVVAGAAAGILAAGYAAGWLVIPHPDATLKPAADEPSALALSMIQFLGAQADPATFRSYEEFWTIEPWFFEDQLGFHCFMLVTEPATVDGANCVPPGVDLYADIIPWPQLADENSEPLPAGSIIRFHYLNDRVDVYLYPPSQTD